MPTDNSRLTFDGGEELNETFPREGCREVPQPCLTLDGGEEPNETVRIVPYFS
jgi:hypothetical protein